MGCDGGTIPKRDELVKVKKKPEAKDKQAELSFQWRCCVISQEALQLPIVTCGLGRLYNKCSVIEGLLNRLLLPLSAKHIRNLKDIKDLNLTFNPEYKDNAEKPEGMLDSRAAPFVCPVTGLEMSGKFRFVCLWSCGCVMSERALKEISTKVCHKCQQPFNQSDIIVLNGTDEDIQVMQKNIEVRQALKKSNKKSKKNSTAISSDLESVKQDTVISSSTDKTVSCDSSVPSSKSLDSKSMPGPSNGIMNNKIKRGLDPLNNALVDPDIKKIKTEYSVAKDPKVTDVYKSLFTTHKSEKQQTRAHWVTYNPFYN